MIARTVSGDRGIPILSGWLGEGIAMVVTPVRWILGTWPDLSHLITAGDSTRRLPYSHWLLSDLDWLRMSPIRHLARYGIPQDPSRVHCSVREVLAGFRLKLRMTVMWLWWVWRI